MINVCNHVVEQPGNWNFNIDEPTRGWAAVCKSFRQRKMDSFVQTFTWHHLPPTVVLFKRAVASVKKLTCRERNAETHRETGEKDKMRKESRKQSNSGNWHKLNDNNKKNSLILRHRGLCALMKVFWTLAFLKKCRTPRQQRRHADEDLFLCCKARRMKWEKKKKALLVTILSIRKSLWICVMLLGLICISLKKRKKEMNKQGREKKKFFLCSN